MTDAQQEQDAAPQAGARFAWTRRHTLTVVVICAALILDTIDISIMNVALPPIKSELGFTEAGLSWVVNGYLVTFGGFLLLCGRIGDILGLVLGGLLTIGPGWRWIFLINVPISALVIAGVLLWIARDHRPARRTQRFDLTGAVLSTAGVTLLTIGIVQSSQTGWTSPTTLLPLIVGLALLAAFTLHEARAKDPLLPFTLLKIPNVAGANVTQALVGGGMFAMLYIATLYQQEVLHYNPLQTGLGSRDPRAATSPTSSARPSSSASAWL
ncbi:MFS transporter [Nonomuraea salmonea]|uniref:MFS transporter n=1 Tax=Nonomuraea salmonea TaxID=46181 RepID=A0ABV5NH77_9ACTN